MHPNPLSKTWFALEALGAAILLVAAVYFAAAHETRVADSRHEVLRVHQSVLSSTEDFFLFAKHASAAIERQFVFFDRAPSADKLDAIHDTLRIVVNLHRWVDQTLVLRPDGTLIASSDLVRAPPERVVAPDLLAPFLADTELHASSPFVSVFGVTRGQTIVFIGRQIRNLSDEPIGVALLAARPGLFFRELDITALSGRGELLLNSGDAGVLARIGDAAASEETQTDALHAAPSISLESRIRPIDLIDDSLFSGPGALAGSGASLGLILIALGNIYRGRIQKEQERRLNELEDVVAGRTRELSDANARLKHSEAALNRAQSVANIGSWSLDLKTGKLTWSDQIFRIFDIDPAKFEASYPAFLGHVHPDDRAEVDRIYSASIRDKAPSYQIVHRLIRNDGTIRWVDERCVHEYDENGDILRSDGTAQDITERKLAEDEVIESRARIEQAYKDLQMFTYVVSHDLQEPVRMVASYLQLLTRRYDAVLTGEAREFVGFAVDGAKRISAMIKDLLELSRVGTHGKDFSAVDLGAVLGDAVANLAMKIDDTGAKIVLPHSPPTVLGDDGQLLRLFQNLIGNALKYRHPDRPPVIEVTVRRDGPMWRVSIKDNGIGIEPQYFERIFVIFQRLHTLDQYEGTGIGLSIAKKIVERHHGRIWLDSEPGKGTTFHVTLPPA